MRKYWVALGWTFAIGVGGCREKAPGVAASNGSALPSASVVPVATGSAPAPSGGECSGALDYLVGPVKYENGDLFRAVVADATNVFFRDMKQVFRVPRGGGKAEAISEAPGLSLSGRTVLFEQGDRLLMQSSNEPIFMASPKSGGPWKDLINLSAKKVAGGRDATTRLLQGLGSAPAPRASRASFDGAAFYWADNRMSRGLSVAASATIRSVHLDGSAAKDLYQTRGEIAEVYRAGERVVFMHTAPLTAKQLRDEAARKKSKTFAPAEQGEQRLMSVPVGGGEAKELARISNIIAAVVLGTDGNDVYVTGYPNGDLNKPGIYRVNAESGGLERLDPRVLNGQAFVVGNHVIFAGSGKIEAGQDNAQHGQVVLAMAREGKTVQRIGCVADGYTAHGYAVAGAHLLISLFKSQGNLASIVRFELPRSSLGHD